MEFYLSKSVLSESMILLLILYTYVVIADIYFMIASAYHLLQLAKTLEVSQQTRFNHEKEWYWMNLAFLASMIFTWVIEICCWTEKISTSLSLSVIADLTKLFTAVNIVIIFVLRRSVKELLFNNYRALKGNFNNRVVEEVD